MEENKDTWRNLPAPQTQNHLPQTQVFRGNPVHPVKAPKPPLSNIISLAAVGAMALIAAIGLWVMMAGIGSENLTTSGRAVLVATGLIVLITGGVLGYAGWNGLRPGWFLWFSIVGAAMLPPVVIGGVGMLETSTYNEYEVASHEFEALEEDWDDEDGDFDDLNGALPGSADQWEKLEAIHAELLDKDSDSDVEWLDPTVEDIELEGTEAILDLRDIPAGEVPRYLVSLDGSTLQVVLKENQLPVIESAQIVASTKPNSDSSIDALALTPSWDYYAWANALNEWLASDFEPEYYPLPGRVSQADSEFTFALHLEDSELNFVVVSDEMDLSAEQGDEGPRNADSKDESATTSNETTDDQDGDDK